MSLFEAAEAAVGNLALDSGERCVIVTDDVRHDIGRCLYEAAGELTDEAVLITYTPERGDGAEPPDPVAAALLETDAFLAPTTNSLTHTRARQRATDAGARGATLPGITVEAFTTGLGVDHELLRNYGRSVADSLDGREEVRVTCPNGTDFTVRTGERTWGVETGLVDAPSDFTNLPAGEVYVCPTRVSGTAVIDGSMPPHGRLDGRTITLEFEDGYVTDIGDATLSERVARAAETVGDAAYNVAEVGIGTNVSVTELVGSILLDEKAAGTVHVAIGDDVGLGGETSAPLHIDGVITDPTVYAEGAPIDLPSPR